MPDGKYMVEKYHIRYTQSLTVSEIIAERKYTGEKRSLLAIGGAVYEEQEYEEDLVKSENQLEALKKSADLAMARGLGVGDSYQRLGYGDWADLPGTLSEVQSIENIMPGTTLCTGAMVDESLIKDLPTKGELKKYRVIHFATHGLVVPLYQKCRSYQR